MVSRDEQHSPGSRHPSCYNGLDHNYHQSRATATQILLRTKPESSGNRSRIFPPILQAVLAQTRICGSQTPSGLNFERRTSKFGTENEWGIIKKRTPGRECSGILHEFMAIIKTQVSEKWRQMASNNEEKNSLSRRKCLSLCTTHSLYQIWKSNSQSQA